MKYGDIREHWPKKITQYLFFPVVIFSGPNLIDEKNREMGGPFALDGRRLMEGHNNQPKVDINDGRGIEEERRPGRNMGGEGVSLL